MSAEGAVSGRLVVATSFAEFGSNVDVVTRSDSGMLAPVWPGSTTAVSVTANEAPAARGARVQVTTVPTIVQPAGGGPENATLVSGPRSAVSVASAASDGPRFVAVSVNVTEPPGVAGDPAVTAIAAARSAVRRTGVVMLATLFDATGSSVDDVTDATSLTDEIPVAFAARCATTVIVAVWPDARVPSGQLTSGAPKLHGPPVLGVADTKVRLSGQRVGRHDVGCGIRPVVHNGQRVRRVLPGRERARRSGLGDREIGARRDRDGSRADRLA